MARTWRASVSPRPGSAFSVSCATWPWSSGGGSTTSSEGSSSPEPFSTVDDRDADFNDLDPERAMADVDLFQRQCDLSRSIVGAAESLDVGSASTEKPTVSLRWVMIHMIEEYARHNGHADLLREQIDGAVGE